MIKYLLMLMLITVSLITYSQPMSKQSITDGPYIFYRSGTIYEKSIVQKNGSYIAVADSFSEKAKAKRLLKVHLDKHPEWDFTVKLKASLINPPVSTKGTYHALILSDIEGEFEPFRNLLLAAKVIDEKYNWTFGKGQLIIAGDLFDRGKQVSQFLWLLYKLEDEAADKGGQVHVILGNHDIMNLDGDFRYVQPEYKANANLMNEVYANLYAADTELGRWLRSKNTIEKIGDVLVMHGGMSPEILQRKQMISQINTNCRPFFDKSYGHIPDSLKLFFGEGAIFWYRGYFLEPKATIGLIDSTLSFYSAKKIIVGHDIMDHVIPLYNGKVIAVDVDEHEGTHEALMIEKDKYYRIDDKGNITLLLNN